MLENMLQMGVNDALFKNEKLADRSFPFVSSATALALGDRICLNYSLTAEALDGGRFSG